MVVRLGRSVGASATHLGLVRDSAALPPIRSYRSTTRSSSIQEALETRSILFTVV